MDQCERNSPLPAPVPHFWFFCGCCSDWKKLSSGKILCKAQIGRLNYLV